MKFKVLVIGEVCDDVFVYGSTNRLNPEAPTPVFIPEYEINNKGMAGNVCANLTHLGIDTKNLYETFQRDIITKTRYIDITSNYILIRVDTGDKISQTLTFSYLMETTKIEDYNAIVVSDYNKGFIDKETLTKIFLLAKGKGIPTFMDTKKSIGSWAEECDFIKINEKEFNNPNHKESHISTLFKDNLIVTLGSKGAKYKDTIYEAEKVPVRDVTGAGDTFLSGLVYGYLKSDKNIIEGIKTANKLASSVVSKKGVALPNI